MRLLPHLYGSEVEVWLGEYEVLGGRVKVEALLPERVVPDLENKQIKLIIYSKFGANYVRQIAVPNGET